MTPEINDYLIVHVPVDTRLLPQTARFRFTDEDGTWHGEVTGLTATDPDRVVRVVVQAPPPPVVLVHLALDEHGVTAELTTPDNPTSEGP